jgi:NAD(P)-dependent dehydrogenase (short-subunit alcohol dehydrogenase family)
MGRLEGKIAIITGASGGIGSATAAKMIAEGARVMLAGRDQARLDAVLSSLDAGDAAASCVGDPAEEADVVALIAATSARFGGVDILFANAGAEGAVAPLTAISVSDFDLVQHVNVRGTWLAIKHAAPAIIARGGGAIVCTSSVAGSVGVAGIGAYAASKHAINGLVQVAALELATSGVRVNAVAPAPIDNAMMASIEQQASPDDPSLARAGFSGLIAMGRYGTNEEVANMVAFLASDEARYCTGGVYAVDGGFMAA